VDTIGVCAVAGATLGKGEFLNSLLDKSHLLLTAPARESSRATVVVRQFDISTGTFHDIAAFPDVTVAVGVVSPESLLVFSGREHTLYVMQTHTKRLSKLIKDTELSTGSVVFQPNQQKIAFARHHPEARIDIFNITMDKIQSIRVPYTSIQTIHWIDSESLIAICSDSNYNHLVYIELDNQRLSKIVTAQGIAHLSATKTGLCLVEVSQDESPPRWMIYNVRRGHPWAVLPESIVGASISPSGERLLLIRRQADNYLFEFVSPGIFRQKSE
jgi:hypothetical protein